MKKKICYLSLIMCLISVSAYSQGIFSLFGGGNKEKKFSVKFLAGDEEAVEEVLQIKIRGEIKERAEADEMPFRINKDQMEAIKKDLELARKRDAIKVILLDINSPGGEVTASDIIYHQIKKMHEETGKPVIALIGSMGASGAYYVACAAQKILAHPTSIIGSIGVLLQSFNVEKLADTLGIKAMYLKSERTPHKDILSPFRKMTQQEKAMLTGIVNSIYDRFVKIVSESRGQSITQIEKVADGSIYTADKALKLGLIDKIGYQEDALAMACEMVDLESIALVKRITKKSFSEVLSEMTSMGRGFPAINLEFQKLIESANVPQLMFKLSLPPAH
jgi:protease-4